MKCESCQSEITSGDEREHLGRMLCEDCYMESLSPMKTCDPWAAHSAKSFEEHMGGNASLSALQSEILSILEETGGLESHDLLTRLTRDITAEELQREFATLRHMEKARAEKRDDRVFLRIW